MDLIENLAELKEMNARHGSVDHEYMLKLHQAYDEQLKRLIEEEDEKFVRWLRLCLLLGVFDVLIGYVDLSSWGFV